MHVLKTFVDGNVYQTCWLFHKLNQRLITLVGTPTAVEVPPAVDQSESINTDKILSIEEAEQQAFVNLANG